MKTSLFCLLAALAIACSSSDDDANANPQSTAKTASEIERLTAATCEAQNKGEGACSSPEELNECKTEFGRCRAVLLRKEALQFLDACMLERACTADDLGDCKCVKSDDACFEAAAREVVGTPSRDNYERKCLEKQAECGNNRSFSNDWCTTGDIPWRLYEPNVHDALTQCFSGACDQVQTCLRGKIREVGAGACK